MSVRVTADASTTVLEMSVHGRWSQQLGDQVTDSLRRCLAGPCEAIVIDVSDVGDLHGVSLPYWSAAVRAARLGPASVRMAFCSRPATTLDYRLRHQDGPPVTVFPTMAQARIAIAGGVSRADRLQARLAPRPASVRAARDLVLRACDGWQLAGPRDDAALIMSELATNAVDHAGTEFVVTVFRRGGRLHLTVRDGDSRYPSMRATDEGIQVPLDERGRGLRLVHAAAEVWGAIPAHNGKVVWATMPAWTYGRSDRAADTHGGSRSLGHAARDRGSRVSPPTARCASAFTPRVPCNAQQMTWSESMESGPFRRQADFVRLRLLVDGVRRGRRRAEYAVDQI
ncbi:ATP-binding protein [Actinoplanes xinjiangensis]|uniref:ATP-binding protein n=1 Tax=Actinoplanes xinjiangensis TaxID=512350 RepID=UPI000D6C2F0D|nr:ATP-binding protein [Actinoplanes xinjiangensis]